MLDTLDIAESIHSCNLKLHTKRATTIAAIAAIAAAISASCPEIISPAKTNTGTNLTNAFRKFISFFSFL